MIDIKSKLDYCFRVDTYEVANAENDYQREEISEFFMIGGKHSILQVANFDVGFCYAHVYEKTFKVYASDEGFEQDMELGQFTLQACKNINKLRELLMLYDYCLTELRRLPEEKAQRSRLCMLKSALETKFRYPNTPIEAHIIPPKAIENWHKACEYLAYACDLEERGIISQDIIGEFKNIAQLNKYIADNDLLQNPTREAMPSAKIACILPYLDYEADDLLQNVRVADQPNVMEGMLFNSSEVFKQYFNYEKEMTGVYVAFNDLLDVVEEVESAKDKTERAELQKLEKHCAEEYLKKGARVCLMDMQDEFNK